MTPLDRQYLQLLIDSGTVHGPVLEMGSREIEDQGGNTRAAITAAGLTWDGADLEEGPGVDWVIDLLDDRSVDRIDRRWGTVLLFNILEHIYDPATALRNAARLLSPGGRLAVVTPTVWQIHDFPADYWRPLPDFYLEFARRHGFTVVDDAFLWLSVGRMIPVSALAENEQKVLPARYPLGEKVFDRRALLYSRILHRALRTLGRQLAFPYSALGLVMTSNLPATA